VTVCGIAFGVLGDAAANCSTPAGGSGGPTDGTDHPVVDVDAPISVCGIGIGVLGGASTTCSGPVTPVVPVTPVMPVTPVGTGTSGQPVSGASGGRPGVIAVGGSIAQPASVGTASPSVTGETAGEGASTLAYTGGPVVPLLLAGLLAMVLGLGVRLLGRRRAGVLG
jgi:hypothetical protein